jgi:V8-like Glu-specific endopeptidase
MAATALRPSETELLVEIIAKQARASGAGPYRFFRDLVDRAYLPEKWEQGLAGVGTAGDNRIDARDLLRYLAAKGTNLRDERVTALGALLKALFTDDLGLEERAKVAAILYNRKLFNDAALVESLVAGMQVPLPAAGMEAAGGAAAEHGPEIDWQGPEEKVELQGWFGAEPDWFDVGFLSRAIKSAAGVCRVEVGATKARGTGFLLGARDLVLTNHHVLEGGDGGMEAAARSIVVRFGCTTIESGGEADGRTFKAHAAKPLVKASPTAQLDYALLRIDAEILGAENLEPPPLVLAEPAGHSALHLLQHPFGGAMKVAFSHDAVTAVLGGRLVQYASRSAVGSSGAPCFDDDWRVVALHHAERSRAFGVIREGVLLSAIHPEIREFLPAGG